MADLRTRYMGLELKNPLVPSASPFSRDIDNIKALEAAGAAAVVLYSLYEEQVGLEDEALQDVLSPGARSLADAVGYFPAQHEYARNPEAYLEHLRRAKEAVDIPIIASLNGVSKGSWLEYATKIQEAGADALELNLYFVPATAHLSGLDVETLYLAVTRTVKKQVNIPVAVKLSPFFSALPNFAGRLDAYADGLVLFNRFYQPDVDVRQRAVTANLKLSTPAEMRLPLRWIAILFGQVEASLALTTGVHSAEDVLKAVLAGADVAHVCSVLIKEGIGKLNRLLRDLVRQMEENGLTSITAIKGMLSLQNYAEPTAFERASYLRMLNSFQGSEVRRE